MWKENTNTEVIACQEMSSILPEESQDSQMGLNAHNHHVLKGREDQSTIGWCPTKEQSTSVDPHHHLDKDRFTLLTGSRIGKDLRHCLVWFSFPIPDSGSPLLFKVQCPGSLQMKAFLLSNSPAWVLGIPQLPWCPFLFPQTLFVISFQGSSNKEYHHETWKG